MIRGRAVPILVLVLVLRLGGLEKAKTGWQVRQLRFSLDGRYVLAQDDSEIVVLTADPFSVRFRIPARDATLAQFTPSSDAVVLVRGGTVASRDKIAVAHGTPHVERWSLTDHRLAASVPLPDIVCGSYALAPDGRTYACDDYQGRLRVIDVASSETILDREKFVQPIYSWIGNYRHDYATDLGGASLYFSPDGRILVAHGAENRQFSNSLGLIWDVSERHPIKARGLLRPITGFGRWAFLDSGHVLVITGWGLGKGDTERAKIVTFPDGKLAGTSTIPLGSGLRRATDPSFVVFTPLTAQYVQFYFGPVRTWVPADATVAVELATGQAIVSHAGTLDVFGNRYVTEVRPGEVGIYERHKGLQSTVVLHQK